MDFGPFILNSTSPPTWPPTSAPTDPPEGQGGDEGNASVLTMLFLTFASVVLTGSTLQWVISRGLFSKGLSNPRNTYNIIVLLAGIFSGIQAICNFLLYYYEPTEVWFLFLRLTQWVIMTHTSIMIVSNKLSMLYRNSPKVWKRLLLINVSMLPISILVFVLLVGDKLSDSVAYTKMNRIIEPTQIALWGIIEFVLSGMFIVKMWSFEWSVMERKAILALVLVGLCDLATIFAHFLFWDLPFKVVKAFAYCLRIRLEINALCVLVDCWKSRSPSRVSGVGSPPSTDNKCVLTSSIRGPFSNSSMHARSVRFSTDDDDSLQLRTVELDEDGTAKVAQIKPRGHVLMDDDIESETELDESLKESYRCRR
ncbi:unnamed protein product [Cylindrotheca closterium]|uniref:Uncharacterized protein n=1 Tax=Cylindrotheca closterium TaxID=2856 RepID=A0AAD2JJQ6_9STRA|nr:unnamed protein product [Cylindrotheca closterium]